MRHLCIYLLFGMLLGAFTAEAPAATLSQQRRELSKVSTSLRAAERMARAGRNEDASEAFNEAASTLTKVAEGLDDKLQKTFNRAKQQLADKHAELSASGIQLPPLADIKQTPSMTGKEQSRPKGQVSFVEQIAPIFTKHCSGCHTEQRKGGFNLGTYNNLMQGSRSGKVIELGAGFESLLLNVITSGEMPPSGDQVPPEEVALLNKWINQNAPFDGDDPDKPLAELQATGSPKPFMPTPTAPEKNPADRASQSIPLARGDETVSFALDVAPNLTATCSGCHLGDSVRAGFSIANFETIWAGGDSGMVVAPGNAEQSLLVQKLRGTATDGRQMPLNLPAWSNDKIALVEKWIEEGAKFDGPSTTESTSRVSQLVRAQRATPEELSGQRSQIAGEQWRLAIPDESAGQASSARFLAVGNLPESSLERLASLAEKEAERVLDFFAHPNGKLNKSHITLYCFAKRIDYSEFCMMVERRELARGASGHATYDLVAPYAAILSPNDGPDSSGRVLAQQVASLWVADQSDGRAPQWFVQGAGMAATAKLWPKDDEVVRWRDELNTAVRSNSAQPNAFMTGKLPPASSELLSFGFVDGLLRKRKNFDRLVEAMAAGKQFDQACQIVFKKSADELAELWVKAQLGRR